MYICIYMYVYIYLFIFLWATSLPCKPRIAKNSFAGLDPNG